MHRLCLVVVACIAFEAAAVAQSPGYHLAGKIALSDGGWDYASIDAANRKLYLARPDAITVVDLDSGNVTAKFSSASGAHSAISVKDGAEILVTDGNANTARFLNAKTGAEIASIKTGERPDAAVFDALTRLVAVMNNRSGGVTLIDAVSHKLAGSLPVEGVLEFAAVDGAGKLFVNIENKNQIAAIDLKAKKVLGLINLDGCNAPTGIAYLPKAKRLLSSCANGVAIVVDPKAMKAETTLPIGQGPDAVFYDASRKLAFVPAGRSGDLSVFSDDPKGVSALGKIDTQRGARTGAVDPKTGRVYLPAADYDPPATAGGRPQVKPGSVALVTVEPG